MLTYKLGTTQRTHFMDDRGVAVDGYKVYFTLSNGVTDYVQIPVADYNSEFVSKAIGSKVEKHEEIASLGN